MKKVFLFAVLLAMAASCTVSETDSIEGTIAPEITASYENNDTKTTITTDSEGVGTIWWKPADEINVFYGSLSTHYFSKNTENATIVAFGTTDVIGITEFASENIWGLYPYDENAECDGESVTTTIPATQKAIAGSFDDDIFTSLAHSTSTAMRFYNVLGGIKFSLSRDDIQSITFKGNNDEDIVGKVKLEMDANGKPVAEIIEGEKTITLTPKEGTTFASGTNYYIVMLPTILSNGFTMTFETETEIGTFEYTTKSIEIKRSVFSKKENIDSYATFVGKAPEYEYVDLGLSVRWATFNLGASSSEEYGDYYAWGETDTHYQEGDAQKKTGISWKSGKRGYMYETYKYCTFISSYSYKFTKYVQYAAKSSGYNEYFDNKKTLDIEDDIAHTKYGGSWRMPTIEEFEELLGNCTCSFTNNYNGTGIKGMVFTSNVDGYKDKSIFLPFAGDRSNVDLNDLNGHARYWTSSIVDAYYATRAWAFWSSSTSSKIFEDDRYSGSSIRPVSVDMDKHIHMLRKISGVVPSPVSAGCKDYYQCTEPVCGLYFEDANGETLIGNESALALWKAEGGQGYLAPADGYVDLGLSVKWAACNIGATKPEEYGDFYAWGEIEPYYEEGDALKSSEAIRWKSGKTTGYDNNSYKWYFNTKYDNKSFLDLDDDVAHQELGGKWRMPSSVEFAEMENNCTCTWTDDYNGTGVAGKIYTSRIAGYTDNSIFLPAAGYRYGTWFSDFGKTCSYYRSNSGKNSYGCLIRAVYGDNPTEIRISQTNLKMASGDSFTLEATIYPLMASQNITWSSSNSSIAEVSSSGEILAKAGGSVTITAESSVNPLVKATCAVSVFEVPEGAVDLGLDVMWATCNIGADTPEEKGNLYAWGEITTKESYSWENYIWCNGTSSSLTKYNDDSSYGVEDYEYYLLPEDDIAQVSLGGKWRMPTDGDWMELVYNSTITIENHNGVDVCKVTSKINGKSIFLPISGHWTSAKNYFRSDLASCAIIDKYDCRIYYNFGEERCYGLPVRAVVEF